MITKKIIACIGDSITFGAGVEYTREKDAWPFVLGRLMPDGTEVLNFGLNGATMQDAGDFPYCAQPVCKEALDSGADTFLLMLGTNDTKYHNWNAERYMHDYRTFADRILALPSTKKLVLMIPPKVFSPANGYSGISNPLLHDVIRPWLIGLGAEKGLGVFDAYRLTESHPEYFDDLLHPNIQGNFVIAEALSKSPLL